MQPLSRHRLWLLQLAREAGDRHFDSATGLCLIVRDTCWYATGLLFEDERRQRGNEILRSLKSTDGTHTPASMLALLHAVPDRLGDNTRTALRSAVHAELINAAGTEWKDGNVNHPLGAYCTLILGGEMHNERWAVELGTRRLRRFQQRIGDHRSRTLRQAEMSEYNSLTYTALDLTFLALIAEFAEDAEAAKMARFLEEALWVDVAMHYHAPSQQFAGPHSRSYLEDSVGGYSALHCALLAATGKDMFLDPGLSVRFDHPSNLLQNALTAITPFHVPERAVAIAWEKPFPFSFTMTTYGESYHENSRRESSSPSQEGSEQPFAFDEEVYPGGWSDLTTFMTRTFALGSAATPYVNAGHADGVMLRISRSPQVRSLSEFRSMFARGIYNGALPGVPHVCHSTSSPVDASYMPEDGRCATYQHENRLIISYTPKRTGHRNVERFSTSLIFSNIAPFDVIAVNGKPQTVFPAHVPADARICLRDASTYLLVAPLEPVPAAGSTPITLSEEKDFFLISSYNYQGSRRGFTRDEIGGWWSGFYVEAWTDDQFQNWEDFLGHAQAVRVKTSVIQPIRRIVVHTKKEEMELRYDPYRERIVTRLWGGQEETIRHMTVSADGKTNGIFCPETLYGREGLK